MRAEAGEHGGLRLESRWERALFAAASLQVWLGRADFGIARIATPDALGDTMLWSFEAGQISWSIIGRSIESWRAAPNREPHEDTSE